MKLLCDKAAAQRPPGSKATRVLTISVIIAGITILILGCERAGKEANSILPPTPETDPLAQPKSLQQVGLPVELTREAIPADNPQTPEKLPWARNSFLNAVCRLTALSRAARAMIQNSLSLIGRSPRWASKAGLVNAIRLRS